MIFTAALAVAATARASVKLKAFYKWRGESAARSLFKGLNTAW